MSWDGKDFSKPLIMLDFTTVQDAINKNAYEPDEDVEKLISENMTSERLIALLRSKGMVKEACDFMSFCVNRRVGVWWAYLCVETVNKEIEEEYKRNPLTFEERQKKEVKERVAEWKDTSELDAIKDQYMGNISNFKASMDKLSGPRITDPKDPLKGTQDLIHSQMDKNSLDFSVKEIQKAIGNMDPKAVSEARDLLNKGYAKYEARHGIHPLKAIEQELMKGIAPEPVPEDTSLRDKYFATIQSKIESIKQYINDSMGKHFPLNIPGLPKQASKEKIDGALFAAKRWILAPTDANGKIAMDSARKVASEPEGFCALSAFWSCTNLTPGEKTQVVPPPGLYSNGIKSTVFMCAMKKGGNKKYDERYEDFFNIGIDCVCGIKTWDEAWKKEAARIVGKDNSKNLESQYGFGREAPQPE
ncbi:hypothetical protein P0136_07495 [Lentisphaerota bacterium ZTH]|nr:hypothetical protein JYG24_01390 [Lentisphaerota bacterium]WET05213.1 hypothetical protein P0136_07495 [Lentisphaerota bacterium ZTH]